MKAEIAERIRLINKGQVPEGYKRENGYIYLNEWKFVSLSTYIKALNSGISVNSDGKSINNNVDKAVLKISCVSDGRFVPTENKKINENEISRAQEPVRGNNILIVRKNTPDLVGNLCYVESDFDNLYLPDLLWQTVFKENVEINRRWIGHFLSSEPMKRIIKMTATGTSESMKNIKKGDFLELKIPKLPINIQNNLEIILSTWDKAIELKEKLISEKKKQKIALMQELLTGKKRLDGFYGEWEEYFLEQISTIDKGKQLNKEDMIEEGIYPALNGGISPSGYTNQYNTEKNTITISEGGNSCGFVNFITENFWCGGHCYKVSPINKYVDNKFLFHLLKNTETHIMSLRVGSGLPNIQKKAISSLLLFIPSIQEQTAIANILSLADKEISLLEKELQALKEQKKGLMQLLLTGIVRVN